MKTLFQILKTIQTTITKCKKCVRPANHFAGRTQLITNFFYFCGLRNFYMTNTAKIGVKGCTRNN